MGVFDRFSEVGRSHTAKASLSKFGLIGFNQAARKKLQLDKYEYAVLFYDREDNRIGIEPTNDKGASGATKLRHRVSGSDISARRFVAFYDIKLASTLIMDVEKDGSMLILDLNKAKTRGESKKRKISIINEKGGIAREDSAQTQPRPGPSDIS